MAVKIIKDIKEEYEQGSNLIINTWNIVKNVNEINKT